MRKGGREIGREGSEGGRGGREGREGGELSDRICVHSSFCWHI